MINKIIIMKIYTIICIELLGIKKIIKKIIFKIIRNKYNKQLTLKKMIFKI